MKIAVYAIALNEAQFVTRWAQSAADADVLLIADTGSTDDTVSQAEALGVTVVPISVRPWRFDDARNASLAVVPDDVDFCVALDLDEVLLPGWRAQLEAAASEAATRIRYRYVWSQDEQGRPGLVFDGNKIHSRHGYRWVHAAHEVLHPDRIVEKEAHCALEIRHLPDPSKSRGQYLELLAIDATERPQDDRSAYYYARELMFAGKLNEAREEFQRFLELPSAIWVPQRAEAMRMLANCVDEPEKLGWLHRAIDEEPDRRELHVALAQHHYQREQWAECLAAAQHALAITTVKHDFASEGDAWGATPHDLAALAAYHLGENELALRYGLEAVALSPDDPRLQQNLRHYEARA